MMKSKVPSMDASIIMRALVGEEVNGNRGGFMIFNEAEVISRFFCRKMAAFKAPMVDI